MGMFKVAKVHNITELKIGDEISESDFSFVSQDNKFVQLEYHDDEVAKKDTIVKPGLFTIKQTGRGLKLETTSFVADEILETFVNTKLLTEKIDLFFSRLHVYKEHGIEIPKRAALLYGPPGCSKTSTLKKVSEKYENKKDTAVIIWPTDKFEAHEIKSFVKSFVYQNVDKLILIAEDIGGVEVDQVRMKSDSSLLSLLDNQEKTFTIPVFIIATTNFPEIFLGNLTNRPGRFDDKLEYAYPDKKARVELLKFFLKKDLSNEVVEELQTNKYNEFSLAHLKEVVIRSAIYDIELLESLKLVQKEIETYNKSFAKKHQLGIGHDQFD